MLILIYNVIEYRRIKLTKTTFWRPRYWDKSNVLMFIHIMLIYLILAILVEVNLYIDK